MGDYVTVAESARKVRAALRAAFPKTKISVKSRSSDIAIEWADDVASLEAMQAVLSAASFVTTSKYWPDVLEADGHRVSLWCFNSAKREAAQRDFERRRQESEAQQKREQAAVAAAHAAKHTAQVAIAPRPQNPPSDPVAYETFEKLRQLAEARSMDEGDQPEEVEASAKGKRRPSWAPPLELGDELAAVCVALGYLAPEDKPIGRLWADFASPTHSGRVLRERVSALPLHGMPCRGFRLWAGASRGPVSALLFNAQRAEDGSWRFGPHVYPRKYHGPREREWEALIRERERLGWELERHPDGRPRWIETRLAEIASRIVTIDAEDAVKAEQHRERQRLEGRAHELARARVLDFAGTPDAQMQTAARLWGHCCRCAAALTDPASLEAGLGPICRTKIIAAIQHMAANGAPIESIASGVGMPTEFVTAVISESALLGPMSSPSDLFGDEELGEGAAP
jgi:hypothetical protein